MPPAGPPDGKGISPLCRAGGPTSTLAAWSWPQAAPKTVGGSAVVLEAKADLFTLKWRDWPDLPSFVRRRWQLALLHPAGRAQT